MSHFSESLGDNGGGSGTGDDTTRRSYFDAQLSLTVVSIFQGDYYTTGNPGEVISTVLGSCIAVCVRDPDIGFGGMNHFLLPKPADDDDKPAGRLMRYGSYSIERLLNAVIARDGRRDRLEIKVFGGANVGTAKTEIGSSNISFVERYIQREGLRIAASDMGGSLARRVRYFPVTGRALVLQTEDDSAGRIFTKEQGMFDVSPATLSQGIVEIFDHRLLRRRRGK